MLVRSRSLPPSTVQEIWRTYGDNDCSRPELLVLLEAVGGSLVETDMLCEDDLFTMFDTARRRLATQLGAAYLRGILRDLKESLPRDMRKSDLLTMLVGTSGSKLPPCTLHTFDPLRCAIDYLNLSPMHDSMPPPVFSCYTDILELRRHPSV